MPFSECVTGDKRDLAEKKVIKSQDEFLWGEDG